MTGSSDVCSSDLDGHRSQGKKKVQEFVKTIAGVSKAGNAVLLVDVKMASSIAFHRLTPKRGSQV